MSHIGRNGSRGRGLHLASRAVAACIGTAALVGGVHADADSHRGEWFRSPVSGTIYRVEHDAATRAKRLVAPDGSTFESTQAVLAAETLPLTPFQRLFAPALLDMLADETRRDEPVDATFIYRRQPAHEAGAAARARATPLLDAQFARQRLILDRIAPLRTLPDGRAPDLAAAMRDEDALLTAEEKATLRSVRDEVRRILVELRREVMAEATAAVTAEQAALAEYVRSLPGAIDFGGSVVLNARSARVPASSLLEIAARFPEVMRIVPVTHGDAATDVSVPSVNAGSWWSAGYNGSSATKIAVIDCGVDSSHPALTGGTVTASGVYHATASTVSTYGDNSSSTDDLQGHGTRVAGIACSTDSTYRGIAYGGLIMNAKSGFVTTAGGASMYWSDGRSAGDWAFNNGATAVSLSYYGGVGGTTDGTNEMSLFLDAAAFSLGIPSAVSAGNSGSSSTTIGYPGDAFNLLACGSIDDNGSVSHSDDSLNSTSSRGPTSDGRQKPDICAPGVGITSTAFDWEGSNADFASLSGTSNTPPLVAGAVSLLQDFGAASYPEGLNALLLNTTDRSSPYGSSADNNWGYGVIDCGAAYTYRGSVYEGSLTSNGRRYVLLRSGSLASGGRVTLAWNRQVTSNGSSTPTTYYGIQDLDLYVYNESTGSQVASSTSTVDPREQVNLTSSLTSPIIKVYRANSSFTSSYSTEPFAVAATSTSSTVAVDPPALACAFTTFSSAVAGSRDTTITVSVANSGDVAAFAPTVTLTLPTGYTITSGANPRTLSDIAADASASVTWVVRSPSGPSGTGTVSVDATSTSFGETITATTLNRNQTVDVDAPSGSVSIANGAAFTTVRDVTVSLPATDAHTSVAQMRVRHAGTAWGAWTTYASSVAVTLPAGDGTKTFEAEFSDAVGNQTSTMSDSIVLDTTEPSGSTLIIAGGANYVNTNSVTLTIDASDELSGISEMRFSNDQVGWAEWTPFAATTPWTLTPGDGMRTVYAEFRDGAGNTSVTTSDTIEIERDAPSGSVSIAGGAAWTTTRSVTLTLTATDAASGVQDMRLGDNVASWGAWQPYAASAAWTLASGDGPKSVVAQFRDAAGNVSAVVSDGIGLDSQAPTGTVSISGGASYSLGGAVTLTLSAADIRNGVSEMRFSNDDANWSAWAAYSTSADWTISTDDGSKTVYVQFKDGVGNVSASVTDTIIVDTTPPTGTMLVLGDRAAINSTAVTLDLTWSDGGTGSSGVADVRLSNDGATWSNWTPVLPAIPWTTDSGDGVHSVHAQFRDRAGNVSATASDTILLDTVVPAGTFVLLGDANYVLPWEALGADTTASDGATGSGVVEFRTSSDGGQTWSNWTLIGEDGRAVVESPVATRDAVVTILGQFRDAAGNVSESAIDATYLLIEDPPSVVRTSSFSGTVGIGEDRDAVHLGLVAGDKLTLKLKMKTLVKKADARVEIDLYGPDGTRLVDGRYPSTSKKPGISKFLAPATGDYLVVIRAAGTAADTGLSYTLTVNNAPAKGSRAAKGLAVASGDPTPAATVTFAAADGFTLGGTLIGTTTDAPTLLAPDGSTVTVALLPGKKGSQKIVPLQLAGGTGTYTLTIPATGEVKYQLALSTGKRTKGNDVTLPAKSP